MEKTKKYILIISGILLVSLLFIFFLNNSDSAVKVDNNSLNLAKDESFKESQGNFLTSSQYTNTENESMPYSYEEWRIFLLKLNNMTIEDLSNLESQSILYLNKQARIYAGWSNGTISDEERDHLFDELHSSPIIGDPTFDRHDDGRFEATFSITVVPLAFEHCFRVYSYFDYNRWDTNEDGGNRFHDLSTVKGPYPGTWPGYLTWDSYPYEVLPFYSSLDPYEGFIGSHYLRSTIEGQQIPPIKWYTVYRDNPLEDTPYVPPKYSYFIIQMLYRYDTMTTLINYQCHFKWVTKIYPVTINDDDTTGPILPVQNFIGIPIDPVQTPYFIYDGDESFEVKVLGYDLESGLGNRITFDGKDVTNGEYLDDVLIELGWPFGEDIYAYWYKYDVINDFGYSPGSKTVNLDVWNNDNDGWDGDPDETTEQVSFWVYDDDTFAPSVNFLNDWVIFDDEANLKIVLQANDISGISNVYVKFGSATYTPYYQSSEGEYRINVPNPRTPGEYNLEIHVVDGDNDGWIGDNSEFIDNIIFTVIDDDVTPPVFELISGTMEWSGTDILLPFWIEAYDESGISSILIEVAGLSFTGQGWHNLIVSPGIYTMYIKVTDGDNDRPGDSLFSGGQFVIILDLQPPVTEICYDPAYINGEGQIFVSYSTEFSFLATDDISGVAYTKYKINDGLWNVYTGPFNLIGTDGSYTIYYYSVDDLGNTEATKSLLVILDNTAPITELSIDPYYIDIYGTLYVTTSSDFILTANDELSGVAYSMYKINDGVWNLYTGAFTLSGEDGFYSIYYYSIDNLGNVETIKDVSIYLISIDVNSFITRGHSEIINYFDVIFRKCKQDGIEGYMLIATNPGEIFYNIEIINTWPTSIETLIIDATLPADFITKGATPYHIFLDGVEITNLCEIDGSFITLYNITPGSAIKVVVHVDYGLKGTFYEDLGDFWLKRYTFSTEVQAYGCLIGTYESSTNFNAYEKMTTAIAGCVYDEFGSPIIGATVELKFLDGTIMTTTTNCDGLYYLTNIEPTSYEVRVISNDIITDWYFIALYKDEITWFDFFIF